MTNDSDINGSLLRHQRESMGWTLADMAAKACLSPKQIKQLEEGGDTAFYSLSIKLNVAKKVAQILGVTEDELFSRIKAPKSSSLDESIEDIEAEQLALLASFESDSTAEEEKSAVEIPPVLTSSKVVSPTLAPDPKETSTEVHTKTETPVEPLVTKSDDESSPANEGHKDAPLAHEPLVSAPVLKTPAQEVRAEASSPANFLSNADSHITQEPTPVGMSAGFKFLLFAVLAFAALVVLSPEVKNNLLELGRQNGLLEPVNTPSSETAAPTLPPLDASQSDTPVEAPNAAAATAASTPAASQVAKPASPAAPSAGSTTAPNNLPTSAAAPSSPVTPSPAALSPSSTTP